MLIIDAPFFFYFTNILLNLSSFFFFYLFIEETEGREKDKNKEKELLSQDRWQLVYQTLQPFLRPYGDSKEGRLDFYHRALSKAVRKR